MHHEDRSGSGSREPTPPDRPTVARRGAGGGVVPGEVAVDALAGALAGCVGAVGMTALQEPGLPGLLSARWRPREFVPRQVVRWLDGRTTAISLDTPRRETAATVVAHLGYGAGMGAAYGALRGYARFGGRSEDRGIGPWTAGALWGLAVWVVGYQGWLPALGVRRATTDHPPTRWPVPMANHVLYGVLVAHLFERARPRSAVHHLLEGPAPEADGRAVHP